MEAVVLSPRFLRRVSVHTVWICLVLFGSLKESYAVITFLEEPQDKTVEVGKPVSLNCTAQSSVNVRYTWQFKGTKIVTNSRVIVRSDGTLHITNTQANDSGDYVCVAKTNLGGIKTKKRSRKAFLTVQSICAKATIVKSPDRALHGVGSDLSLECSCTGTPSPTVEWSKDSKPLTVGAGRLSTSGSTLTIKKLEIADSGKYECTAKNVMGTKKSSTADITVIKTAEPVFKDKPLDEYFVKIGQDLTMKCSAIGKPSPAINWYYDFEKDPLTNSSKHTLTSNGSLFISNIDFVDMGNYKCQAKNIVNSKSVSTKISEAFLGNLRLSSPTYPQVGSKLSIACKPRAGPSPAITWQKANGGPLPASYTNKDGTLVNQKVKITDSGNFTCTAKNIAGTTSAKVTVIASVFPTITAQPKDTLANENSKVKLDCTVNSSPASRVSWIVNNKAVKLDSNHKINSNNALVFKKISLSDTGLYRCSASHPGTTIFSRVANVTVRESVKLADYIINHHKFDKGSTAKLYCGFKGSGPISVKWKKAGSKKLSNNMVTKDGVLTINKIDMANEGVYTCTGYNQFSNVSANINISVFVYPKFVVLPKNTTAKEFDSIWLHCSATGYPKPKINWGKEEHGGDVLDSERFHVLENGTLFIENLQAKDQGRYYCIAGNIANFKQVTISVRVVSPGTTANSKASAMGRTIAIAVGCAAAYIILVVGLMIYCKRRRAKQQKKEELTLPIDGELENCEANPEIALQPINGKPANYNKMEFPRHDLEALRTLGNGSYGRTFLARASGIKDGERETMVVVKSLMSKDDIQKEDFWRELNALVNMDNPNVVGLLGVCRDIDPTYMIFESLEKGDLKQYLLSCYENGRSTLTSSQKLSICSNLVSGMTYLASNKFTHKDVAARNCMVSKDSQVKIGFLSLSYDLYSSEYFRFNNILIPLRWMAPEAIFNDDFTEKSDVWSFGVLVWEIYTLGQTPFEERADEEVLKCIKDDLRLSKPDNCPDSMANIMVKCWEENPEDRPTFDKLYAEISEIAVDTHL